MVKNKLFESYNGKRVLVTGHTGFKGSWLIKCLKILGAKVYGYSLENNSIPNHYSLSNLEDINEVIGNILDVNLLKNTFEDFKP